jgi:hypothetical protein
MHRRTGEVFLLSAKGPINDPQFVNSNLESFLELLCFFHQEWGNTTNFDSAAIDRLVERLCREIERLDPPALKSENTYWSTWIQELKEQRDW